MKNTIFMDKAGRVVIPKSIRTRLQLRGGDLMELDEGPDSIILRPVRTAPASLVRCGPRLVWDAPDASLTQSDVDVALSRGRQERDQRAAHVDSE